MSKGLSGQSLPTGGWDVLGKVLPVVAIDDLQFVDQIVEALINGGVSAIEITLRTPVALEAIERCARVFPNFIVGAGTVLSVEDLERVAQAGARFALSPGFSPELVKAAWTHALPFIPGVATPSEVMAGLQLGVTHFKLFPAAVLGGVDMLKAINGPMPQAKFCPTGGVQPETMKSYLAQPNVYAVGMTRLVPSALIQTQDWSGLTALARQCVDEACLV